MNMIEFRRRQVDRVQIKLPLGSVDQARRGLECLSTVVRLGWVGVRSPSATN
jgi:hypothetical protein